MAMASFINIVFSRDSPEAGRRRLSIFLTILALLCWSHSILLAWFEIGYLGLISGLPITFFIGLALLTIASAILWVSRRKHSQLLCFQLLILVLALGLVPLMTGGTSPFVNHVYRNLGYVDYIVRQAHFDTQFTFYLSWPGAFVLPSVLAELGSIDFQPLVEVLSFLMPLLSLLPLYVFLKNTLGEDRSNYVWAGCWFFCLAGWGSGNLISAMGMAVFFLLVMLALVTNPRIWQKEGKSLAILSLIVIIFAAMVASHLLTSLSALVMLAALSLVRWDKRLALTAVVCLAILLAWNLTVAGDYVIPRLPFIGEGELTFDFSLLTEREITGHFLGSGSHVEVATIRMVHAGLFFLIGFAGFMASLIRRKELKTTFSILAITVIPLPLVVLSGYYAKEILTRVYAFVVSGMAYFGTRLFDTNKRAITIGLCLLLLAAIPLNIIATYGNQELDYFSPAQRQGTLFFHEKTSQGLVFGSLPVGQFKNIERYANFRLGVLELDDGELVIASWLRKYSPHYIVISRQDRAFYGWFLGDPLFVPGIEQGLKDAVGWDFVYNNPDMQFYIYEVDEADDGG